MWISTQHRGYVFAPRIQVRDFSEGGEVQREDSEHQRAILGLSFRYPKRSEQSTTPDRSCARSRGGGAWWNAEILKEGNGAAMRFN